MFLMCMPFFQLFASLPVMRLCSLIIIRQCSHNFSPRYIVNPSSLIRYAAVVWYVVIVVNILICIILFTPLFVIVFALASLNNTEMPYIVFYIQFYMLIREAFIYCILHEVLKRKLKCSIDICVILIKKFIILISK